MTAKKARVRRVPAKPSDDAPPFDGDDQDRQTRFQHLISSIETLAKKADSVDRRDGTQQARDRGTAEEIIKNIAVNGLCGDEEQGYAVAVFRAINAVLSLSDDARHEEILRALGLVGKRLRYVAVERAVERHLIADLAFDTSWQSALDRPAHLLPSGEQKPIKAPHLPTSTEHIKAAVLDGADLEGATVDQVRRALKARTTPKKTHKKAT